MSKKITGFTLDENVIKAIEELAKKDDRSKSNYVNIVLTNHIKEAGYNTKPAKSKKTKLNRRK